MNEKDREKSLDGLISEIVGCLEVNESENLNEIFATYCGGSVHGARLFVNVSFLFFSIATR